MSESRTSWLSRFSRGSRASVGSLTVATNRREIVQTAFDFTGGAYRQAVQAKRATGAVLGLATAGLGVSVLMALSAHTGETDALARLAAEQHEATQAVASFGEAPDVQGGTEALLSKERALASALQGVAAGQVDYAAVLEEIETVQVPGVRVVSVRIGKEPGKAAAPKPSPSPTNDSEAATSEAADPAVSAGGTTVTVTAAGSDLLGVANWAQQMRSSPMFLNMTPTSSGTTITMVGKLRPQAPPQAVIDRVEKAGFSYTAPDTETQGAQASGAAEPQSTEEAMSEVEQ